MGLEQGILQFDEGLSAITIFKFILTCSSWVREYVLLVLLLQEKKLKEFHCSDVHRFLEVYVCWGEGGIAVQMGCQAINSSYLEQETIQLS